MDVYDFMQLPWYITTLRGAVLKGTSIAVMESTNDAVTRAKKNAIRNFTGTSKRPKTGNLVNAIFGEFEVENGSVLPTGYVGVRAQKGNDPDTRPYGRIREYGGKIVPRKAKFLWIPMFSTKDSNYKYMTPSKTFTLPGRVMIKTKSGYMVGVNRLKKNGQKSKAKNAVTMLYNLVREVNQVGNPYLTPAVDFVYKRLPSLVAKRIKEIAAKPGEGD